MCSYILHGAVALHITRFVVLAIASLLLHYQWYGFWVSLVSLVITAAIGYSVIPTPKAKFFTLNDRMKCILSGILAGLVLTLGSTTHG